MKLLALFPFAWTLTGLVSTNLPALAENVNVASSYVGDFDRQESILPQESDGTVFAADYYVQTKRFAKAIRLLERKTKECPREEDYRKSLCDAHIKFGDNLAKRNENANAIREYQAALQVDSLNKEATDKMTKLTD